MKRHGQTLIVDDSSQWYNQYQCLLENMRFTVSIAQSYSEALGQLQNKSFILAIVDLKLASASEPSNLHGIHFLKWVAKKKIPFIIISAYVKHKMVDTIYQYYPDTYILDKSCFNAESFKDCVKSVKSKKFYNKQNTSDQRIQSMVEKLLQIAEMENNIAQPFSRPAIVGESSIEFSPSSQSEIEAEFQYLISIRKAKRSRLRILEVDQARMGYNSLPHMQMEIRDLYKQISEIDAKIGNLKHHLR